MFGGAAALSPLRYQAIRERLGSLDCVVVRPESHEPVAAAAVFCHGFGAGGDDLVGIAGELLQMASLEKPVAMLFPAAPLSLADQGMPDGRAWWLLSIQRLMDALGDGHFEQIREEVPEGIEEVRDQLSTTIALFLSRFGLDASQLMLGGFSQGAMICVETACLGLPTPPRSCACSRVR